MAQVITTPKLSDKGFIINDTGSDMLLEPRINQDSNNQLQLTDTGLLVPNPTITLKQYTLNPESYIGFIDNQRERKLLSIAGNIGIIHLDFKITSKPFSNKPIPVFTIPSEVPRLILGIETLVQSNVPMWWYPNKDKIYVAQEVRLNERIIFHVAAIFE